MKTSVKNNHKGHARQLSYVPTSRLNLYCDNLMLSLQAKPAAEATQGKGHKSHRVWETWARRPPSYVFSSTHQTSTLVMRSSLILQGVFSTSRLGKVEIKTWTGSWMTPGGLDGRLLRGQSIPNSTCFSIISVPWATLRLFSNVTMFTRIKLTPLLLTLLFPRPPNRENPQSDRKGRTSFCDVQTLDEPFLATELWDTTGNIWRQPGMKCCTSAQRICLSSWSHEQLGTALGLALGMKTADRRPAARPEEDNRW